MKILFTFLLVSIFNFTFSQELNTAIKTPKLRLIKDPGSEKRSIVVISYDKLGNVSYMTEYALRSSGNGVKSYQEVGSILFFNDADKKLYKVATQSQGNLDILGTARVVNVLEYNNNNTIKKIVGRKPGPSAYRQFTYDSQGLLVREDSYDAVTNSITSYIEYKYDQFGNCLKEDSYLVGGNSKPTLLYSSTMTYDNKKSLSTSLFPKSTNSVNYFGFTGFSLSPANNMLSSEMQNSNSSSKFQYTYYDNDYPKTLIIRHGDDAFKYEYYYAPGIGDYDLESYFNSSPQTEKLDIEVLSKYPLPVPVIISDENDTVYIKAPSLQSFGGIWDNAYSKISEIGRIRIDVTPDKKRADLFIGSMPAPGGLSSDDIHNDVLESQTSNQGVKYIRRFYLLQDGRLKINSMTTYSTYSEETTIYFRKETK